MVKKKFNIRTVFHRRKRVQKTNYPKRLNLLKSRNTRLVLRQFGNTLMAQLIDYDVKGDRVLVGANSSELTKLGWKHSTSNLPAAYLTGMLLAKKLKEKKLETTDLIIVDLGIKKYAKKTKLFAIAKGAVDNGLNVSIDKETFPDEKRIKGAHIAEFAQKADAVNKLQFAKDKEASKITDAFEKLSKELKA